MANTLKLGAGKWATGTDTVLAFNDLNNNIKPLPFSFSRASSATIVNQSGLIETVGSGEPRIDFLGNTKGALLLEPQRTNSFLYSNEFSNSNWNKNSSGIDTSIGNNGINTNISISPEGSLNADRVNFLLQSDIDVGINTSVSSSSGTTLLSSVWIKGEGSNIGKNISFHLKRASGGSYVGNYGTLELTSEWVRIKISPLTLIAGNNGVTLILSSNDATSCLIYGAQLEQGSYATSYIPTSGQSGGVTRVGEVCNQTPPSGVIGQTEGTVYLDFTADTISAQTSNPVLWYMKDGGIGERYIELYSNGSLVYLENNGSTIANITKTGLTVGRHKCVIAYKNNDMVFYVDGVQVGSDVSGTPSGFSTFGLQYHQSFYTGQQKVNQVKLYNTRLSNAELQALTSN